MPCMLKLLVWLAAQLTSGERAAFSKGRIEIDLSLALPSFYDGPYAIISVMIIAIINWLAGFIRIIMDGRIIVISR